MTMTYVLYNQDMETQGSFNSIQELRNYLCDRKYEINCDNLTKSEIVNKIIKIYESNKS